jgi:small subunit ribosomal protein S30e
MLTRFIGQVEPQEKKKTPKGRAKKRITYNRRFVNVTMTGGKRKVGYQSERHCTC